MFKRAFDKFLEKPNIKPKLYPYIYSINFQGLKTKSKKTLSIEPIKCSQCGAVLTDTATIKEDKKIGVYFKCVYCGTINLVSKEQIIETIPDDSDFIIKDIEPKEEKIEKITGVSVKESELYISVIDISGSMSGGKIEAVKKSLIQTLKDYKINAAMTKFILIAFESSVYYYLRHDQNSINFSGEILFSKDGMKKSLKDTINQDTQVGSIGEFAEGWISVIKNLRSMDMTALGPALYYAISTFEILGFPSGRITLLTDGLANQGIGNLSGTSIGAEKFYEEIADLCNKLNILVDVVGVSSSGDNNEMGLQTLGKLTDATGGKLFLITSEEMEAVFGELRQTNYVGKDVKIKIITPKDIEIKEITGAFSSKSVKEPELKLGAVTESRELYLELDPKKKFKKEVRQIPVQLQIEYEDEDGRKRLRVIEDKVPITDNVNDYKAKYDQKLNVMMNIQSAGSQYYGGGVNDSKNKLNQLKKSIESEMHALKGGNIDFDEEDFSESIAYLNDELEEIEMEEEKVTNAPKASFFAAKGQSRARMSQELKKQKLKKKKQK
ncbi:MAG: hypothetical protein GF353_26160 [Candidatus Lokiarchaeota archaeon]|nr:hypothetical protein [Candidatus Lokiarchaeota archaeon]